jgi:hypothetical protein
MRRALLALALSALPPSAARAQNWHYPARPPAAYPGFPHGYFYPPGRGWAAPYGHPMSPYRAPGYAGMPAIVIAPFGIPGVYPPGAAQYPPGYATPGNSPPQGYLPQNGQAPHGP